MSENITDALAAPSVKWQNPLMAANWKEEIRSALSVASRYIPTTDIADKIGIDRDKLYQFLSKGSLNANDVRTLEKWLSAQGYYPEAMAEKKVEKLPLPSDLPAALSADPLDMAIRDLLTTVHLMLIQETPRETKAKMLRKRIDTLTEDILPLLDRVIHEAPPESAER